MTNEKYTEVRRADGRVIGRAGPDEGGSRDDEAQRVREMIEGPCQRSMDTGTAQVVDVTGLFALRSDFVAVVEAVQRAIDLTTDGTAAAGYVVGVGRTLVVVFRGVAPVGVRR